VVPGSRAAVVTDEGITVYPARCEGDRWRAVQARYRAARLGELYLCRHCAMLLRPALAAPGEGPWLIGEPAFATGHR
jgi:hypothetical protein